MNRSRVLVFIIGIALVSAAASAEVLKDIEYASVDGISLKLDLYLPDDRGEKPLPLVIWIHGGGWRAGNKAPTRAPRTLGSNYAVASIDYRLTDQAIFPAQIHDCKAAVRWLRAHAEEYGLDPDRFGAWGSSAGGHLVALLGTSGGVIELEGTVGDHLEVSSRVQAVCDYYGPTNFLALLDQPSLIDRRTPTSPESLLLGGLTVDFPDLAALASPVTHVDPTDPPFLIVHGDNDRTVPYQQSVDLHQVFAEAGVEATLHLVGRAGHGGFPPIVDLLVKDFFDRVLDIDQATRGDLAWEPVS